MLVGPRSPGEELPRGHHQPAQGRLVQRGHRPKWMDAFHEADLVLVDVADAGQRPLVEQRLADAERAALPHPVNRRPSVEVVGEQIRPQRRHRRVPRQGASAPKLGHRNVEGHRLEVGGLQHHPHRRPRAPPALAGTVDVPAPLHPQVAAEDEIAGQLDQEVLSHAAHRLHRAAGDGGIVVHPRQLGEHGLEADQLLAAQRPVEGPRGAEEGVPLRHGAW
jgi:hypothetical protein